MTEETVYECSVCNSPVGENAEKCPFCGADLSEVVHDVNTLAGVNGWLLVLCLVLVFFIPVTSLINILLALDNRSFYDINLMGEMRLFMTQNLIYWTATGVFSFIAGLNLWKIRKGAVLLAKMFLIFYLLMVSIKLALFYFTFFFMADMYLSFLPNYIFAVTGMIYLHKSRRVSHTFCPKL